MKAISISKPKKYKTYQYKEIQIVVHPDVYEPSDDTLLLLENIKIIPTEKVLELGTGTGIISIYMCKLGAKVVATDVNPHAIDCAKFNAIENNVGIDFIRGDLFECFTAKSHRDFAGFDIIVFNPPYLPTEKGDRVDQWFDAAVSGGRDGCAIISDFLDKFDKFLNSSGRAYIVLSSLNEPDLLLKSKCVNNVFSYEKLGEKRFDFETLYVYKLTCLTP